MYTVTLSKTYLIHGESGMPEALQEAKRLHKNQWDQGETFPIDYSVVFETDVRNPGKGTSIERKRTFEGSTDLKLYGKGE